MKEQKTSMERSGYGLVLLMLLFVAISEGFLFIMRSIPNQKLQDFLHVVFFETSSGYTVDGGNFYEDEGFIVILLISVFSAFLVLLLEAVFNKWRSGITPWWIRLPIVLPYIIVFLIFIIRIAFYIFGIIFFLFVVFLNGIFNDSRS